MKSVEELHEFFKSTIKHELKDLEGQRQKIVYSIFAVSIVASILMIATIFSIIDMYRSNDSNLAIGWMLFLAILIPLSSYIIYKNLVNKKGFYISFKTKIIERIVKFIDQSFIYISHKCIQESFFDKSNLFAYKPVRYTGDDYIFGNIKSDTKITCSEINSRYLKKNIPGQKPIYSTLFKGLFLVASTNLLFKGSIFLPKNAPYKFDTKDMEDNESVPLKLVNTGNEEFQKYFKVYSRSIDFEINPIITDIAELLVQFKHKYENDIYVSFFDEFIFVAISHKEDLFEPNLYHSFYDFKVIQNYYEVLYRAIELVNKIHYNSELYMKEKNKLYD